MQRDNNRAIADCLFPTKNVMISSTTAERPAPTYPPPPEKATGYDPCASLTTARKNLISLKKELDCGTPLDPGIIAEMEAAIARLAGTEVDLESDENESDS